LEKCETFVALSPNDRYSKTKDLKICVQCLDTGHYVKECKAPLCTTCGKTHHVLLHFPPRRPNTRAASGSGDSTVASVPAATPNLALAPPAPSVPTSGASVVTNLASHAQNGVLPTACAYILDSQGRPQLVRILIDQCSTDHLITTACATRLGLPVTNCSVAVSGVGLKNSPSLASTEVQLHAQHSEYSTHFCATLLENITSHLPLIPIDTKLVSWITSQGLPMADANFATPGPIDILIGVDLYSELMEKVDILVPNSCLHLVLSKLGWIVFGSWGWRRQPPPLVCNVTIQLEKFWEMEELF